MATNNYLLRELSAGGTVKDYKHAARIFLDSNYRLAPKNSYLFHVAFDVDVGLSMQGQEQILEAGLLVKSASLPQFNVDTEIYNAYNRSNIVQTKVKYNSINITLHDDNADVVRDFWYNYYNFYYRDSDASLQAQHAPHKYQERMTDGWGYTPRTSSTTAKILRSIRIYVLHQKRFTEYLLVNPTITRWSGSELDTTQGTGLVESTMTVDYEAVIFSSGSLKEDNVPSFFNLKYDNKASDISPGPVGFEYDLPAPASLPDQIKNGYKKIVSTAGDFAGAARDVRNVMQQGQQFKKDIRAFQTGMQDFKNFGKYIAQGTNPFAQIRVPDLTNLTRGIAQADGQIGRAVGIQGGILGSTSLGQALSTAPTTRSSGSISSNQAVVSTPPPVPEYWTSVAGGARPPLPSVTSNGSTTLGATNAGQVESAVINSGYVAENQSQLTKNLFTNSKNLQSTQTVANIVDRLDAAAIEQQQQQFAVEQYLNTKTSDTGE